MKTVYLVEDSPLFLGRIRDLLAGVPGNRVVGDAATADAAIAGILEAQPDIVLLDINLAEGSGFDVLRELHPRLPKVAFYMLSGVSADPYRGLAQRLGARAFLDKTKDIQRIRELMEGERSCLPSSC